MCKPRFLEGAFRRRRKKSAPPQAKILGEFDLYHGLISIIFNHSFSSATCVMRPAPKPCKRATSDDTRTPHTLSSCEGCSPPLVDRLAPLLSAGAAARQYAAARPHCASSKDVADLCHTYAAAVLSGLHFEPEPSPSPSRTTTRRAAGAVAVERARR